MDWMKYRKIYFTISLVLICIGIFSLVRWGLNVGVDFKGGTTVEYQFDKQVLSEEITSALDGKDDVKLSSIQTTGENKYLLRLEPINPSDKGKIEEYLKQKLGDVNITELRFETVGPTVGPELVKKTAYAVLIAAGSILIWVAYQFKSFRFGISAILAMFHDSFILIGLFSLLSHFWNAEADFLFVTAMLTTLSFSVHDTIVVFDRIREIRRQSGMEIYDVANQALTETMVRSLNNSFTIIFMLVALLLLGGVTIKWFAAALLIGTILGTYSSPFVAVPLLVSWDGAAEKIKKIKLPRVAVNLKRK
jgi:preprotein translocase subunit SecF